MDFDLPPELAELQATVRKLSQERIAPRAREIDLTEEYPQDLFELFVETGLAGLCVPEEYGGSGAGILGLAIAIEEVAKYSNAAALMLLLTRLPTGPLLIAGSEAMKHKYLTPITTGAQRAAFGLSEPQAGSDVMSMRTKAVQDGDDWVISGTKCWMSGVRQADWYCIFAKTGPVDSRAHDSISAFVVERAWDGVSVGRVDKKMGVKGVDTGELILDEVRVPAENVVGDIGGFRLCMLGLNAMRPIVAARGIGLAEGALMYAVEYAKQRQAFTKTIADFQGIQWKVAELATEIEAARLLTYRAAWMADRGQFTKEFVPYLSMCKYYATELAVKVSNHALQMLGAAGYMQDHPMELYYRDAKQLTIVEGTTQVQLGLIAKGVLNHDLWWDQAMPVTDATFSWPDVLAPLTRGDDLDPTVAEAAMATILGGSATDAQVSAFAVLLRAKGETPVELAALVRTMLQFAEPIAIDPEGARGPLVDTCGTGGDRSHTFNISTVAALVIAGAGVRVAKHGNRAASSACGSADLLEELGVVIDLGPEGVVRCIDETNIAFCFARRFHAAMRFVGPVRAELGVATTFNFLGPLANPARVTRQVVGVSDPAMADRVIGTLRELGARRAMVFFGHDGLDELTTTDLSTLRELRDGEIHRSVLDPLDLGISRSGRSDLQGGDPAHNAKIARRVLDGEKGALRDVVLLNAAAALVVADAAADFATGIETAAAAIDTGHAARTLDLFIEVSKAAREAEAR